MGDYTVPKKWQLLNCLLVVLAQQNQQDLDLII